MRTHLRFFFAFSFALALGCACTVSNGQSHGSSTDDQIRAALHAAPAAFRDSAAVLGYDAGGELVSLRQGENSLVCLADDPSREGFSVTCYHRDLEPVMARGRELRAKGHTPEEVLAANEEEVEAGTLKLPDHPSTMYFLSGEEGRYVAESDTVEGAKLRYVIHVPYATAESLGLPTSPTFPGEPWLMDPGTHRAHIMITPP